MSDTRARKRFRSQEWFDNPNNPGMTALYLERYQNQSFTQGELQADKPIIGIANTGSDLAPCNKIHVFLMDRIKAGIRDGGGIPMEFPVHPIQETGKRPTAALDRNLAYLSLVEVLHGYPIDGVVLTTGCDKTTPAQLMGAATMDIPAIALNGGPMLDGWYKGKRAGSGTTIWEGRRLMARGEIGYEEFMELACASSPSLGHCNTMGTASTMNAMAEALGMSLPGNSAIPAPFRERMAMAYETGKRCVQMVLEDLKPSDILTKEAFENAILANAAVGGSTNAVVHLLALAGRVGVDLSLEDFEIGSEIPLLVNCMPSGKYLMEDFCYAGGMPVVLRELGDRLRKARTVLGGDIAAYAEGAECWNRDVIRSMDDPLKPAAGLRVLRGNLAPRGAIVKPSAATDALLEHEGEAYVFDSIEDLKANIDREDLPVTAETILVLKGCGPKGYPGMPEVGNMPIPRKLVREGVRDMIRVSDARMSGTAFGTVILHVSPEANDGGTLALVKTGDRIRVSARNGVLELLVDEAELAARRAAWTPEPPHYTRGYAKMYIDHVLQADQGADLDFLVGKDTRPVTRESH